MPQLRLFATASVASLLTACATQMSSPAASSYEAPSVADTRVLAEFPNGTFLENLLVESDGDILVTSYTDKSIIRVAPDGSTATFASLPVHPSQVIAYGNGYVAVGHGRSFLDGAQQVEGSNALVFIDAGGKVEREVPVNGAVFLNGIALAPDGSILAADSLEATVWKLDPQTGGASVVVESDALLYAASNPFSPGANGVELRDGYLYVSSSGNGSVMRAPYADGRATGPLVRYADFDTVDDFTFLNDGSLAAATHAESIMVLDRDGKIQTLTTPDLGGPTAVALGQGPMNGALVVSTTGHLLSGGKDPARVYVLDLR